MVADEAVGQIFLPRLQRHVGNPLAGRGNRRRFRDVDRLRRAQAYRAKRRRPVELGRELLKLSAGHHIVGGDRVAPPLGRPLILRQPRLERDDAVGATFGIGQAGELA